MRLDVLIEGHLGGHVEILGADEANFSYEPTYIELPEPTPLSVRFPLSEEVYA